MRLLQQKVAWNTPAKILLRRRLRPSIGNLPTHPPIWRDTSTAAGTGRPKEDIICDEALLEPFVPNLVEDDPSISEGDGSDTYLLKDEIGERWEEPAATP